jgi:hypothetical protein
MFMNVRHIFLPVANGFRLDHFDAGCNIGSDTELG